MNVLGHLLWTALSIGLGSWVVRGWPRNLNIRCSIDIDNIDPSSIIFVVYTWRLTLYYSDILIYTMVLIVFFFFLTGYNEYSAPVLVEKNSVVVMHALDRIVETLSSSHTDRGLFFAWSPDGKRIGIRYIVLIIPHYDIHCQAVLTLNQIKNQQSYQSKCGLLFDHLFHIKYISVRTINCDNRDYIITEFLNFLILW